MQMDATEFRERQRQDWDTASEGWHAWDEQMSRWTRPVSERMVEMAGIKTGDRVLDVACGLGEPALTAAKVVGLEGHIVATDISSGMLARGRERAAAAGLENVEFVESDAASLDYPEGSFDAALSRWGIIFEPDGEGTAGRIRGFVKDGGKFAISSWGPPDRVPMLGIPMGTVMTRLDVPPPPPGTPGPLSRPTPEAIASILEGGGFSDVQVEEVELELEWDSPEEFTRFIREIAPPVSNLLAPHPPEVQDETWAAITEAVRAQSGDGGKLRQKNLALIAAGTA